MHVVSCNSLFLFPVAWYPVVQIDTYTTICLSTHLSIDISVSQASPEKKESVGCKDIRTHRFIRKFAQAVVEAGKSELSRVGGTAGNSSRV